MKNIHLLPTDQPSRLHYFTANKAGYYLYPNNGLVIPRNPNCINQNIYITSDEEIKEGDWVIYKNNFFKIENGDNELFHLSKKIILTTDQDLIKDGVQAIPDEFLEWFVKNPSCEYVEVNDSKVVKEHIFDGSNDGEIVWEKKIIIPKEESKQEPLSFPPFDKEKADVITKEGQKVIRELHSNIQQETLEEAAYRLSAEKFEPKHIGFMLGVIEGAKWQAENMPIHIIDVENIYVHIEDGVIIIEKNK